MFIFSRFRFLPGFVTTSSTSLFWFQRLPHARGGTAQRKIFHLANRSQFIHTGLSSKDLFVHLATSTMGTLTTDLVMANNNNHQVSLCQGGPLVITHTWLEPLSQVSFISNNFFWTKADFSNLIISSCISSNMVIRVATNENTVLLRNPREYNGKAVQEVILFSTQTHLWSISRDIHTIDICNFKQSLRYSTVQI